MAKKIIKVDKANQRTLFDIDYNNGENLKDIDKVNIDENTKADKELEVAKITIKRKPFKQVRTFKRDDLDVSDSGKGNGFKKEDILTEDEINIDCSKRLKILMDAYRNEEISAEEYTDAIIDLENDKKDMLYSIGIKDGKKGLWDILKENNSEKPSPIANKTAVTTIEKSSKNTNVVEISKKLDKAIMEYVKTQEEARKQTERIEWIRRDLVDLLGGDIGSGEEKTTISKSDKVEELDNDEKTLKNILDNYEIEYIQKALNFFEEKEREDNVRFIRSSGIFVDNINIEDFEVDSTLKENLEIKRISQTALAEKAKLSRALVVKALRKNSGISLENAYRLSLVVGISIIDLFPLTVKGFGDD